MSCYFTKICVQLLIIAALCNFGVNKLIGWDPENIYLFKVHSRNIRRCEICLKLTVNTVERRSGVFINFEHISNLFLVFLLFTTNK